MSELDEVVGFLRRLDEAVSPRSEPFEHGVARFAPELPLVHWLNELRVELGTGADAAALAAAAERLQGGAGLGHRRVAVDDAEGERLAPGFRRLGWQVEEQLVLVRRGDRPPAGDADEVTFDELAPLLRAENDANGHTAETVRQLVEGRRLLVGPARARYFVARAGGEPAAHCELYTDGRLAQIENVNTLPRRRGRGLATQAVRAALAAAAPLPTFLLADADDWPAAWYRRLGFERIGRRFEFLRPQ